MLLRVPVFPHQQEATNPAMDSASTPALEVAAAAGTAMVAAEVIEERRMQVRAKQEKVLEGAPTAQRAHHAPEMRRMHLLDQPRRMNH
jgi:hypothetical protein